MQAFHPGFLATHVEEVELGDEGYPPFSVGLLLHQRGDSSTGGLGDGLQQLHIVEVTPIAATIHLINIPSHAVGNDPGQAEDALFAAIEAGDVDQSGDRLLRTGGLADHMQPTGQQARLNFHQLAVHLPHQLIPLVCGHGLGIRHLLLRQRFGGHYPRDKRPINVLVQIHQPRLIDDRVGDGDAASRILQGLVGGNQFVQLLQPLVQPRVFCRGGEVADGLGVAAPFGDRRFGGVVGSVIVEVGDGADQVIGVAGTGHAHLLTRHELQRSVGAEVKHRIRAPNPLQIGVVGGKAMVGTGRSREQ